MGSAYNGAQTLQGEGGDFNVVNTYFLNVYDTATFTGDVTFESDVLVQGKMQASEVELVEKVSDEWVPYNPPKRLSDLFDDVDGLDTRVTALESATFDSVDLSYITDSLGVVQARTATLESLIGLLNNNNPSDTVLENRITNLESKITALISVYQSIKAIHNMPINLS